MIRPYNAMQIVTWLTANGPADIWGVASAMLHNPQQNKHLCEDLHSVLTGLVDAGWLHKHQGEYYVRPSPPDMIVRLAESDRALLGDVAQMLSRWIDSQDHQ